MGKRPNVIVFFTDQQRWDSMGLHGNPLDLTPNLDRAARAGTHLAQNFSCQPVCGPARSIWQSGRYPTQTGCHTNARPLPTDGRYLAHEFNDAGYRTGYIGKWHLAPRECLGAVDAEYRAGYRDWFASNVLEFTSDAYHVRLWDGDGEEHRPPGYRVDALTDAAIRYVADRSAEEDPFFLFLSYIEPHHQNHVDDYPPPEGYRERYDGRHVPPDLAALGGSAHEHLGGYWGMIKRLDEAYGRLLDALSSLGLRDDTIVLFTSDHGCHFKTRNGEYKRSCHESSIRVPGAFTGGPFTGGGAIEQLVSLIDLPATLLDACGIPVPERFQGRSLMPLLRGGGGDPDWPAEVFVQTSEAECGRSIRTARWKYGVVAPDTSGQEPWAPCFEERYLYDLHSDPHELRNLIGIESFAGVVDELRERLLTRMEQAGEQRPEIVPAEVRKAGQRRPELFDD